MTTKITTIQKEYTRYTFTVHIVDRGNSSPMYSITTESLCKSRLGSSLTTRYVSKDEGNAFYKEMIAKGFKKFRNIREVSWYATIENNTPYEEEWTTKNNCLIPVKSRVLTA